MNCWNHRNVCLESYPYCCLLYIYLNCSAKLPLYKMLTLEIASSLDSHYFSFNILHLHSPCSADLTRHLTLNHPPLLPYHTIWPVTAPRSPSPVHRERTRQSERDLAPISGDIYVCRSPLLAKTGLTARHRSRLRPSGTEAAPLSPHQTESAPKWPSL